jgi:uncharacterized protein YkwD
MRRTVAAVFSGLLSGVVVAIGAFLAVPTDPPIARAAGGGYVNKCGGGEIFLNVSEKRTFALHNRARRKRDLKPFCVHPTLQKAARAHSKDMIERDYFSHDTKARNEDACERIRRFGYRWRECGENIGYDSTPEAMFDAWMESSGHRANILSGRFREVGVGAYSGDYRGFKTTMYAVDFGVR